MTGTHDLSRMALSALALVMLAIGACRHAAPEVDARKVAACRAAQWHDDGRIHIDGARSFRFLEGDSLVLIVNDREWWRGIYEPCNPRTSLISALRRAIPASDSVLSAEALIGRSATAPYHLGGRHPDAIVVRTAPPPE